MNGAARDVARSALRRILPALARRKWVAALAQPLFLALPSLRTRLKRIAQAQPVAPAVREIELDDAQLRVLLDLRDALPPARR
jgi:hypothetical protein